MIQVDYIDSKAEDMAILLMVQILKIIKVMNHIIIYGRVKIKWIKKKCEMLKQNK